jgi:hypothetical protein
MGNKRLPFRVEMARAWHEGRKTVTRRIMKPQPTDETEIVRDIPGTDRFYAAYVHAMTEFGIEYRPLGSDSQHNWRAPYAPGSTVIIAEPLVKVLSPGGLEIAAYAVDETPVRRAGLAFGMVAWQWKVNSLSGRYMPNWAARSWGTILTIRVERLQEITEEDSIREGVDPNWIGDLNSGVGGPWNPKEHGYRNYLDDGENAFPCWTARESYRSLINAINGPGTWQANPYVFRYELEKLAEAPHE